jgi:uncharacterized membrane protein
MVIGVLLGIFFGIRRFWWWYLGIDRMVAALESIDESLQYLPGVRVERSRRSA